MSGAIRKSEGIHNRKLKTVDISGREVWGCDKEEPVWTLKKLEMFYF